MRLHYYLTIKAWWENFEARGAEVVAMQGERFARMWDFYLAAVELGFLHGSNMVYRLLLTERRDAVPLTRGFIEAVEAALRERQARFAWA